MSDTQILKTSTHMVADSHSGLKVIPLTRGNFFSGLYAVQFLGTKAECELEMKRLQDMEVKVSADAV